MGLKVHMYILEYKDDEDSNWVEYDVDVNRKFYYENIPFNF